MDVQYFAPANPRPYDDTGWTFPLMRNVQAFKVNEPACSTQPMTLLAADAAVPGTITGEGAVLIVEHTTDNTLATFRFRTRTCRCSPPRRSSRRPAGSSRRARSSCRRRPRRRASRPSVKELGLTAYAVRGHAAAEERHDLDVPAHRLRALLGAHAGRGLGAAGLRHVRRALHLLRRHEAARGQPARAVRRDRLPARRRDAAVARERAADDGRRRFRTGRRSSRPTSACRIPRTTSAAAWASRGSRNLAKFVQDGGTLIVEGSTTTLFPAYGLTSGVTVEEPGEPLRARVDPEGPVGRHEEPDRLRLRRRRRCRSTSARRPCCASAAAAGLRRAAASRSRASA